MSRGTPRRPSLRRLVTTTLVVTAVVSMLVVTAVNFVVTDRLITERLSEELESLLDARVQAIAQGLGQRQEEVSLLAADEVVVDAVVEMGAAVAELSALAADGELLSSDERTEVDIAIGELLADPALRDRFELADLDVPSAIDVDDVGAALLSRYFLPAPDDRDARLAIDSVPDPDAYDEARSRVHQVLRERAELIGARDLMLITFDDPRVVYTTASGMDLGADPVDGPLADGELGDVLTVGLPRVSVGEAVYVDVRPYLGAGGEPLLLVAASVLDDREVVGAIVAQFPMEPLDRLMTADGRWEDVGLGETGETFVVGREGRLRSNLRTYLEDPEAHVADLRARGDDRTADAVEALGTTVFVEQVDTEHGSVALDGRRFVGRSTASDGTDVLAAAVPLGEPGLDWVVVAEVDRSEARATSMAQLRVLLILAAIGVPVVAAIGVFLARLLARPVGPLLAAADAVAAGEREVTLEDRSSDEFGHLARQLRAYAVALEHQEQRLAEERDRVDAMYASVLPERVAASYRDLDEPSSDVDDVTVVVVVIDGLEDVADTWSFDQALELGASLERQAAEHGLERMWSAADRHLFTVSGRGPADPTGAVAALRFLDEVVRPPDGGDGVVSFAVHAAVAVGRVRAGVVGRDHVAYGVWGAPVASAMWLGSVGAPGELLVDASILDAFDGAVEAVEVLVHGERRDDAVPRTGRIALRFAKMPT